MDKPIIVTQFGQNCLRRSVCLLRKAVFDWLAECKDVNDAGPSRRLVPPGRCHRCHI
jgi:hypothetical protein